MENLNGRLNVGIEDNKVVVASDLDRDGKNSISIKLSLKEGYEEIFAKGIKKEDVKLIDFEMGLNGLKLKLDTDQDGEELLELHADIMEIVDEAGKEIFKKGL